MRCRAARGGDELVAHLALRRRVFVDEQRIFEGDDADERDRDPRTVHALGFVDGQLCGVVRLYPLRGREWKGDRLAVAGDHRDAHVGAELVRFAVRTAGELGGSRMIAHIQLSNVGFFEALGWKAEGPPAPFHGIDHQLMAIPLGGA